MGCPACSGRYLHSDGRNSMAKTHTELAQEYQGDATKIMAGTSKKLSWKCSYCEHEWKATGINRYNGKGCPVCAVGGFDSHRKAFVYVLKYEDSSDTWVKCGITNNPYPRLQHLNMSAKRNGITITNLAFVEFEKGIIAKACERELLNCEEIRYVSKYEDIDGKREFFRIDSLERVEEIIGAYLEAEQNVPHEFF